MFGKEEKFDTEKSKLRYKLYAPESFSCRDIEGLDKFDKDDYRGKYPAIEFARKIGKTKCWYQIVDTINNKVIEQDIKEYAWDDGIGW